jgi:hypothetical protein
MSYPNDSGSFISLLWLIPKDVSDLSYPNDLGSFESLL